VTRTTRLPVTLLLVAGIAGCAYGPRENVLSAPEQRYPALAAAWVGHSASELTQAWGPPTRLEPLAGGQTLEYLRVVNNETVCDTTFTADATGTIRSWAYSGADCQAPRRS
jgi:hypothetical protein